MKRSAWDLYKWLVAEIIFGRSLYGQYVTYPGPSIRPEDPTRIDRIRYRISLEFVGILAKTGQNPTEFHRNPNQRIPTRITSERIRSNPAGFASKIRSELTAFFRWKTPEKVTILSAPTGLHQTPYGFHSDYAGLHRIPYGLHSDYTGFHMDYTWIKPDSIWITLGFHMDYTGFRMDYTLIMVDYTWITIRLHMDYTWITLGLHPDYTRITIRLHMDYTWIAFKFHLDHTRIAPESHLNHTWSTPELHLNHTWSTPGLHLNLIWITPGSHLDCL
jgi:hypothetical protein